jgi:hypothetical protein
MSNAPSSGAVPEDRTERLLLVDAGYRCTVRRFRESRVRRCQKVDVLTKSIESLAEKALGAGGDVVVFGRDAETVPGQLACRVGLQFGILIYHDGFDPGHGTPPAGV